MIFTETVIHVAYMQERNFNIYWIAITIISKDISLAPDHLHLVTESRTNDEVLDPSAKVNVTNDPEQLLLKIKQLFHS